MSENDAKADRIRLIQDIIVGEQAELWEKKYRQLEVRLKELEKATGTEFKKVRTEVAAVEGRVAKENAALRTEIGSGQGEVQSMLMSVKKALTARIDQLAHDKLDVDAIGEFLMQWGKQVKDRGE